MCTCCHVAKWHTKAVVGAQGAAQKRRNRDCRHIAIMDAQGAAQKQRNGDCRHIAGEP